MKKCASNQELIIPPDKCAYCKDLPSYKVDGAKTEEPPALPKEHRPLSVKPVLTSWTCDGPLLKENGITYSGKHIIPTDELTFLFLTKTATNFCFPIWIQAPASLSVNTA